MRCFPLRPLLSMALASAAVVLSACSSPDKPATVPAATAADEGPRITQFYSTLSQVARGEKALVCYGVENATTVWLEPPRQELSAALSRCVEVEPEADTTYKLTAEDAGGKRTTS